LAKTNNAQRDWLAGMHPVGRIGTVEEAAQAVVALLENPFITGSSPRAAGRCSAARSPGTTEPLRSIKSKPFCIGEMTMQLVPDLRLWPD